MRLQKIYNPNLTTLTLAATYVTGGLYKLQNISFLARKSIFPLQMDIHMDIHMDTHMDIHMHITMDESVNILESRRVFIRTPICVF